MWPILLGIPLTLTDLLWVSNAKFWVHWNKTFLQIINWALSVTWLVLCDILCLSFRSAGDDAKIRVWRVPEGGLKETLTEPELILQGRSLNLLSRFVFCYLELTNIGCIYLKGTQRRSTPLSSTLWPAISWFLHHMISPSDCGIWRAENRSNFSPDTRTRWRNKNPNRAWLKSNFILLISWFSFVLFTLRCLAWHGALTENFWPQFARTGKSAFMIPAGPLSLCRYVWLHVNTLLQLQKKTNFWTF